MTENHGVASSILALGTINEGAATCLAGRERADTEARWDELVPPDQDLAANIS